MEDRPNSPGADPVVTQLFDALTERLTGDIQSGKPIRGSLLCSGTNCARFGADTGIEGTC